MTAYQRAVALFAERGPMNSHEFAPIMWPIAWKYCESKNRFFTETGYFLTDMKRRGLLRRNGQRQYYVRENHDC